MAVFQGFRLVTLRRVIAIAAITLFFRVLIALLAEYRWYFPADFEHSAFLTGRRETFVGSYAAAFYVHILSGPPAILLAFFMMISGGQKWLRPWHRVAGRLLAAIVLGLLVPSGLVMARRAFAGPIAGAGLAALSITTAVCVLVAAYFATKKNFPSHRRWAIRGFILLTSPLVLRLASGVAIAAGWESEWFYRFNAWLSWLLPLVVYEVATNSAGWPVAAIDAAVGEAHPTCSGLRS